MDDGSTRYWVKDNGKGLTEEQQARLFKPFTRLHDKSVSGHGLGLSIARRIVDRLGGEIGVESEPGTGCVFYFTLSAKAH
jgi:signal transduction histidine kinase